MLYILLATLNVTRCSHVVQSLRPLGHEAPVNCREVDGGMKKVHLMDGRVARMALRWLQKAFDVPLVIQMTDDEKFLWKACCVWPECSTGRRHKTRDPRGCMNACCQGEYDPEKGDNLCLGRPGCWKTLEERPLQIVSVL